MLFLALSWCQLGWIGPAVARELPHLGESLSVNTYRRLDDDGGPVRGRWRRSDGSWLAWETRDDTIVRLQLREGRQTVLERRFDGSGWPLTTHDMRGVPRIEVHTVPPRELLLSGWSEHEVPGGTITAPLPPFERPTGGAELLVLDGTFDVWHDPIWADVYAPAFRDDLVAGCGCDLVDEASTWVDGRPGKRFRLALPTPEGPALTDLWVVPVGEGNGGGRPQGIWLASWRVVDPVHDTRAMAPGRAMIALVRLSRLEELVAPAPAPEPAPEPADAQDAPS